MRLSHIARSARIVLREQGPKSLLGLVRQRTRTLVEAKGALRANPRAKALFLQKLINGRLEFDELILREQDVAGCDTALLKAFVLHRYADAQAIFVAQAGHLDPLALVLLCDMLYRQWRYRDLVAISSMVRARISQRDLLARVDTMLRRAAVSTGFLSEAEQDLHPLVEGSFAEFLLRGDVWNATGRMDLATEAYEHAIRMSGENPMARLHYGFHLMKKGRLADGLVCWSLAERIFGHFPLRVKSPAWRGEPLDQRRLLIVFEHGFGDMIQFARYLTPLRDRYPGVRVTGLIPAPIRSLFAASFPEIDFVSSRGNSVHDFHVAMTQLPVVLGAPFHEPKRYIAEPPRRLQKRGNAALRVGVCWRGHPRQYEQSRSVSLADFASLFSIENVRFTALLNSVTVAEREVLARFENVEVPAIADFLDLAGLITDCDLVVSVDTSIVHLAGAMGKPVVLMSRPDCCWRWGASGATSSWYDDIKIVRHPFDLDWPYVMAEARSWIERMTAAPRKIVQDDPAVVA